MNLDAQRREDDSSLKKTARKNQKTKYLLAHLSHDASNCGVIRQAALRELSKQRTQQI